jgi:hypothetical protein
MRFEREQRFAWKDRRPLDERAKVEAAALFWGGVFGVGAVSGQVTQIPREVQAVKLIERVQLGDITTAQYEQLTGFLDAERLGVTERVYNSETARRRREASEVAGRGSH